MRISELYGAITAAWNDWKGFLANPRYYRSDTVISWSGYQSIWTEDFVTLESFLELIEKGQYSFQVAEDGGIVQIYYEFDQDGRVLKSANLGYYGGSITLSIPNRAADSMGVIISDTETRPTQGNAGTIETPLEISAAEEQIWSGSIVSGETQKDEFISWFRFDFDSSRVQGILHGLCHLHIGGLPNSRLLVKGLPNPRQFIELIIASCYPELYRKHRLDQNGQYVDLEPISSVNEKSAFTEEGDIFKRIIHFFVPGS
jgi:hypothetical protein